MSLHFQILGKPGGDNALWLRIDSGHAVARLLFDCGGGCLDGLDYGDLLQVDELFFSHLHMDHVAGFDSYFRALYQRDSRPNRIWGPPDSARILQHRMQGYLWNLHADLSATWWVYELHDSSIQPTAFRLQEAFAQPHPARRELRDTLILDAGHYTVEAITMDHKTPTLAYIVREAPRQNVDPVALQDLGLRPGPWLQTLKSDAVGSISIAGQTHDLERLRAALLQTSPGHSIAYLTDFRLDPAAMDRLADRLAGVDTLVCEAQYRHADLELAQRHFHMTTVLTATLARRAAVGELVLFHLSDRYQLAEWQEMLQEAQALFPATRFPAHWLPDAG